MLIYFTNHNHLQTVLIKSKGHKMTQKSKAYIYVLNTAWVKIEFVKDDAVVGNGDLAH